MFFYKAFDYFEYATLLLGEWREGHSGCGALR